MRNNQGNVLQNKRDWGKIGVAVTVTIGILGLMPTILIFIFGDPKLLLAFIFNGENTLNVPGGAIQVIKDEGKQTRKTVIEEAEQTRKAIKKLNRKKVSAKSAIDRVPGIAHHKTRRVQNKLRIQKWRDDYDKSWHPTNTRLFQDTNSGSRNAPVKSASGKPSSKGK